MNKSIDEIYLTLLRAKQEIALYAKEKVKNENWRPYYNGLVEKLDDIVHDYAIATEMSTEDILNCMNEINKINICNDMHDSIKMNL